MDLKPSDRKGKKWMVVIKPSKKFPRGKKVHFGAKGYSDYTKHKDPERKQRYIDRHSNEDWSDPFTPATLARYILWEHPTIEKSWNAYKRRFASKIRSAIKS